MTRLLFIIIVSVFLLSACQDKKQEATQTPPNIIYILADDMGYGELGCYGQDKIETPNIDKLSESGMLFTQHYSGSPVCAPARCNLLTGQHPGHAFVRGNHEWGSRGEVWNYRAMINDSTLEGQYPMPDSTITIAKLLQDAGYATAMVGKWGLGAPHTNSIPTKMGFDYFCGYNCQRIAHTYYPVFLYENEHRLYLDNDTVKPHKGLKKGSDINDADSYKEFRLNDYAPDIMHTKALNFIKENKDHPFFLYYASPIPHLPLQAPEDWLKYYKEKFGNETPLAKASYYPNQFPRAAYAAMISYLDEQVGNIVKELKELGLYENTLIIFTSDNGPTYIDADVEWFSSANPFQTKTGRTKGYLYEGGIRVPMIASWPKVIPAASQTNHISAFWDVMPTLCNIAGIKAPVYTDGISFLPTLEGNIQKQKDYYYWEFAGYNGQQAVRMGKWKGIRKDIKKGNLDIELYDLDNDIKEEHNLADKHPTIIKKIEDIMMREHHTASVDRFKLAAIDSLNQ